MKNLGFILRRLMAAVPVLAGMVVFTFILMRVLPGDPATFYASWPDATPEQIAALRAELGLDRPLYEQLVIYFRDALSGDLGTSLRTGQPVASDLMERLPASLELTIVALLLALLISIPLGVVAAIKADTPIDHAVRAFSTLGVSVPTFVAGLLLIYLFYFVIGWAPEPFDRIDIFVVRPPEVTGFLLIDSLLAGNREAFGSAFSRLILPSVTMALAVMAPLTRMTRASMIGVLGGDFIRTARAAGLSWWKINVVYALRNALIPVLTTVGLIFSFMLGANILVEKVFAWPGVGSYALNALLAADYAPVQGYVLLMGTLYVGVNLAIDVIYGFIDPRIEVA